MTSIEMDGQILEQLISYTYIYIFIIHNTHIITTVPTEVLAPNSSVP